MRTPSAAKVFTATAGLTPIMVRKFVSKENVTIIGKFGAISLAALTAASTSCKSLMVSIKIASTPPATKALI